ncbi:MAG: hypothetical protein WB975_13530 [Nitrososphaeraceae archaeon]
MSHIRESLVQRLIPIIQNMLVIMAVITLVIILESSIRSGYALSDSIETVTSASVQPSSTLENLSTNLIPNFSEFIGFDKNFSMQYPSDWTLEPQINGPEQVGLKITVPSGVKGGMMRIGYSIIDSPLVSAIKKNHIKQEDFEKNLHILFPLFVNGFGETLDNFDQVKKLNYIKFLIGGHKAGSAIFSFSMDEDDLVGLLVWTLVGSNQYWFEYVSDKESFDQKLPLAEKVLQSIKIPQQQPS